jgi:hypothetical protein
MKPHAPIRMGEPGVLATSGSGGVLAATDGVGATVSTARLKEVRASLSKVEPRVRRRRSQWLERLTSPRVCGAVVGSSLLLLAISGVVAAKFLGQQTRGVRDESMAALSGGPAIASTVLEELRGEADQSRSRLIVDRLELKAMLERMAGDARRRGWNVEMTRSSPVSRPGGVGGLVAYPVVMQLSPARLDAIPGFGALVEWLEGISKDSRNATVTGLSLDAQGKRRGWARVEIQVLGTMVNDEAPPE